MVNKCDYFISSRVKTRFSLLLFKRLICFFTEKDLLFQDFPDLLVLKSIFLYGSSSYSTDCITHYKGQKLKANVVTIVSKCNTLMLILTLRPTDWLWGTLCAACTRRSKHFAIEPSQTRGWRWIEWSSPGPSTEERCSGWRTSLRNWIRTHINRWRNSARFVRHILTLVIAEVTGVADNMSFLATAQRSSISCRVGGAIPNFPRPCVKASSSKTRNL